MSDSTGLLIGLGAVVLGVGAIYYLVKRGNFNLGFGEPDSNAQGTGTCAHYPSLDPNGYCFKAVCNCAGQTNTSNYCYADCASAQQNATTICNNACRAQIPCQRITYNGVGHCVGDACGPGGAGSVMANGQCSRSNPSGGGCISLASAEAMPYDGRVVKICDNSCPQKYTTCILGNCNGQPLIKCTCGPSTYPVLKSALQANCTALQGRGGGGTPNFIVKEANCDYYPSSKNYCWHPVGSKSPTTCAQGSCVNARGAYLQSMGTGLNVNQTTYNRVLNSPSDQMRLVIS